MTRPRYTTLPGRAPTTLPAFTALWVAGIGLFAWAYTVDDAFITARYARNLTDGLGYAMNPGHPSDGVTGPLWLLPQLLACAAGVDPIATAKLVGLACASAAAYLAVAGLRARARGGAAAAAACALFVFSPSLPTWGVAGLETGLATLLVTIAAGCALARPRARVIGLGACVFALAWLRPELALLCLGLLASVALRARTRALPAFALALAGALSVSAFRWYSFGDPLPLSYRAKAGTLGDGLHYTLVATVLATGIAGAALCLTGALRGGRAERVLACALLLHLAAVVLAGGDWMPGYRLLVPALPLYVQLAALAAARGLRRRPAWAAAGVALACALPALDLFTRLPELRASADGRPEQAQLAHLLAARTQRVALLDVGFLGYASRVEVIDLGGLTDPVIARAPGGHLQKRIPPDYLRRRDPDAIVLHSRVAPRVGARGELQAFTGYPVEQRLFASALVRERFRVLWVTRFAPQYYYVLLTRAPAAPSGT